MKLEIPKVVKPIELSELAPEFGEARIWVWVNLTVKLLEEYSAMLRKELSDEQIKAWFAEVWSQGEEGTRWTVEEVAELIKNSLENDPVLWGWLTKRTGELIREHQAKKKKDFNYGGITLKVNKKATDETLARILRARMINYALGGAVVGPGDVDDLQEELVEGCRVITNAINS